MEGRRADTENGEDGIPDQMRTILFEEKPKPGKFEDQRWGYRKTTPIRTQQIHFCTHRFVTNSTTSSAVLLPRNSHSLRYTLFESPLIPFFLRHLISVNLPPAFFLHQRFFLRPLAIDQGCSYTDTIDGGQARGGGLPRKIFFMDRLFCFGLSRKYHQVACVAAQRLGMGMGMGSVGLGCL